MGYTVFEREGSLMFVQALPIGVDNFEKLVTRGYYFVDKTNFIRDLLELKGDINLFIRPRRFGKTLNLSMLQYFFEDMRDGSGEKIDNSGLFEGLHIMRSGEQYLSCMGQYPVIHLTLKSGRRPTYAGAYSQLLWQIRMEYDRHYYLLKGDMKEADREIFRSIIDQTANEEVVSHSIQFLSRCLEQYHGRKAVILIDEYDVPLENAYTRGFYGEMADFIRSLFESALKTNDSLEFAVITGCLRIAKESIFTGMNNLKVTSILDSSYDEYFGFTEEEVKKMCGDFKLPQKYDIVRRWYNGYIFGGTNVYNPWSVVQFMDALQINENAFPKSYWANTSSNSIVRDLIERADESVKGEIESLLTGQAVEKRVHEDITYDEVYKSADNLWNFMFFTGYFRKVGERVENETKSRYLTLAIPNCEVEYIFREKIMSWFQEKMRTRDFTRLYTAFANKEAAIVEEELNRILMETISYMDEKESYYHGLVAGLFSPMKGYRTKSNREGGLGRSDLFIKPVSKRKEAFIVEIKVAKKIRELEVKADEALKQIEDKKYAAELEEEDYGLVSCYGIAFCGKECLVKVK